MNIRCHLQSLCHRPMTDDDEALVDELFCAHYLAATQNANASNQHAHFAGLAGVELKSAFISALSVIGGHHAPVTDIRQFITARADDSWILQAIREKRLLGWGNSFHKGVPDPAMRSIAEYIADRHIEWHAKIERITGLAHSAGKMIYPNAGLYTAVVADIIELAHGAELLLVALPRLSTWTKLYIEGRSGPQ